MLHDEWWVWCACVPSSVCGWVYKSESMLVCLCRWICFYTPASITLYLCVYANKGTVSICSSYMHTATHPCSCITLHSEKAYREFYSVPEELHLFFLSLQLGETNRPVMQQWEALNAKHIIREEGSREEEEEGGRQKENWNWKSTRKGAIQQKVTNEGPETGRWTYPGSREWEVRWRDLARRVILKTGEWER